MFDALAHRLTHTDRRLLRVGLPNLVSNGVLLTLPVLARIYLGPSGYATWALLMTVVVAAFTFDLGGTAYIQSAGYGVRVHRILYVRSIGLAALGVAVVTAVALLASLLLSGTLNIPVASGKFSTLVVVTGLAAAVRSGWTVTMARLQVTEMYAERTWLSLTQSALQVAVCWLGLASGLALWSLAVSLVVSAGLTSAAAHVVLRKAESELPPAAPPGSIVGFASVRTLSAVLGTISSQADRWVIGSIAAPTFLTTYDLALRLASLPLSVVLTLVGGLIAEAAAAPDETARRALVRRTTALMAYAVGFLSLAGLAALVASELIGLHIVSRDAKLLVVMALVWLGANALTAPTTMTFTGIGRPAVELRYTVPTLALSILGWSAAVAFRDPWLVPLSTLVAVTTCSLWFVRYGTVKASFHVRARRTSGPSWTAR